MRAPIMQAGDAPGEEAESIGGTAVTLPRPVTTGGEESALGMATWTAWGWRYSRSQWNEARKKFSCHERRRMPQHGMVTSDNTIMPDFAA
jgi:hypothetical protein